MIRLETFLTVLHAACLTHRVESNFKSRGGLLLVAPPGQMKTSMLSTLTDQHGVMGYSDMTTRTLVEARDYIASKKVHTLLLYDFQKIYERKSDTAANIVGSLRALVEEGFSSAAWEEQLTLYRLKRVLSLWLLALRHSYVTTLSSGMSLVLVVDFCSATTPYRTLRLSSKRS